MRIFAIKDETLSEEMILSYLVYYENHKTFYIELPDGADRWETPLILSSFAERGEYSIDSYWSRRFVQNRIIPQDRQNISQILHDNGLKEYDEFSLLMLSMGRCEQDDCYLEEIPSDPLPEFLAGRWKTKVTDIVPLEVPQMLVFFRNGLCKRIDIGELDNPSIAPHLVSQDRFEQAEVQTDGYGIYWNNRATVPYQELFRHGMTVPLALEDLNRYVRNRVVSASEACAILDCSRQNIDDLMRRDRLHPIRTDAKYKLFSRAEVTGRRKVN